MRRSLVVAAVLLAPAVVHADSFLEILGGVSIPVADDDWTKTAESSPKLELRAGGTGPIKRGNPHVPQIGGALQLDWTPVTLDNSGFSLGGTNGVSISAHRYRILPNVIAQLEVAPNVLVVGRIGIGIDIIHASSHGQLGPISSDSSDTDVGFGFELGGGVYYNIGSVQLGGELALPIGHHSKNGNNSDGNYHFVWTSTDIDLLIGARISL